MKGERMMWLWLWQTEHTEGYFCHRYFITVHQMMANVKLSKWWFHHFFIKHHWFGSFLARSDPISHKSCMIEATSSGMSHQMRDIYSICRWCWNVEITSFVLKRIFVKLKDEHSVQHLYLFCACVRACVRPCVRACVRPSVRPCVRPSVRPSVCLSVFRCFRSEVVIRFVDIGITV